MKLNDYQTQALRTRGDANMPATDRLLLSALGLGGESGEYVDEIKKHVFHGKPWDHERLAKELGDVLWYLAYAADINGLTLSQLAEMNLAKLRKRYPEGFTEAGSAARKDVIS